MRGMLKFIKDWMLPIAMLTGAMAYPWVSRLAFMTPYLIFAMLLLTFCKISPRDLRFHPAQVWLLLIQLIGSGGVYLLLRPFDPIIAAGAMLCVLTPTATAAAVITGMLGGNVGFLTTYVLACNVAVAVAAPVAFTLIGIYGEALPFFQSLWYVCSHVFPLLVLPLFVALALRRWMPRTHGALLRVPRLPFYLWAVSLTIVTGITVRFLINHGGENPQAVAGLLLVSLVLCVSQFLVGRRIGRHYGDAVSSGQGLGQKNTILAIWMAQTYLHPLTAVAPSGYILWQNIINSYQLWRYAKRQGVSQTP